MDWCNYSWNYSWVNVWLGVLMNANELAEILESDSKHTSGRFTYSSRYIADIATMLRQQQAEIEALKAVLEQKELAWVVIY